MPESTSRASLLLAAALCAGLACKRAPAAVRSGFCPQDLSGVWVNASDVHYGYRLRDHGAQVDGLFFHRAEDGGAAAPDPTEEPIALELHRTATALAGSMRTFDRTPGGRRCPVEFGLQVAGCEPRSLRVVSETSAGLGEDCKRARSADGGEPQPDLAEYIWDRPDGGS